MSPSLVRVPVSCLLPAALVALLLSGCPEKKKDKEDPNVIAMVNGEVLSRDAFERELSRELQSIDADTIKSPEHTEPLKRALLQTLTDRMLLRQAARENSVAVSSEEIDRGVLRISSDYPAGGFDEALAQGQLSLAELKERTATLLLIEKLFQEHVYPRVAVTEEDIRRHFEEHSDEFQEPEQVRAAQIVVKGLDDAKRIQAHLRSGKKFAELARKYSLSADAKVGGDLGFFARGVMPPTFDEVCFSLGVGQVSDIVESEYGFHLFRVMERRPARKKELSEVRRQVEETLLNERRAEAEAEYLAALKEKATLQVNEQTLQAVTGKASGGPRVAEP